MCVKTFAGASFLNVLLLEYLGFEFWEIVMSVTFFFDMLQTDRVIMKIISRSIDKENNCWLQPYQYGFLIVIIIIKKVYHENVLLSGQISPRKCYFPFLNLLEPLLNFMLI